MPPRESLRPGTNADVDEYVRIRATQGVRAAKVGGRTPIVDADISWDEVPARRSRRRHPVAAADDWGLAESDAWVVEPQPASERSRSTRERGRRERSVHAARDGLPGNPEAADQSIGDWSPWEGLGSPDREGEAAEAAAAESDHRPPVDDGEIRAAAIDRAVADSTSIAPPASDDIWEDRPSRPGERRTIVITGRGAERSLPPRQRGWEASLPLHERSGFKPDRVAMWAVLLGLILLLVAAASSHAATLAANVVR
jgi:hypothetical protein